MQDAAPSTTETYVLDDIIFNDDARMAVWIHERLGIEAPVTTMFKAFGLIRDGQVIAGAYFANLVDLADYKDIMFAAACDVPVQDCRKGLKRVFEYPFVELGLPRVTAQIAMTNSPLP